MKIRVIPAIALATLMASHFARACDYQATPLECINVLDPALVKELVWGPGPDRGSLLVSRAANSNPTIPKLRTS